MERLLVEAKLSDTFSWCWKMDYGNQVFDHVMSTFRKNGNGEWTHFCSNDGKEEAFRFPQKDGGTMLLQMDKSVLSELEFTLYASLTEKGSEVFFKEWNRHHFGSLDPSVPNDELMKDWENRISVFKTVDGNSKGVKEFETHFELSRERGSVVTESYMEEIKNAAFTMYPKVAVEKEKGDFGYSCYKTTMFGMHKGQEIMITGGTEWRMRTKNGETYPDEYIQPIKLYTKEEAENGESVFVENAPMLSVFKEEMRNIYRYNGHSEDALGNRPPDYIMTCSHWYMDTVERDMKSTRYEESLPMLPTTDVKALEKEFRSAFLHKEDAVLKQKENMEYTEKNGKPKDTENLFIHPDAVRRIKGENGNTVGYSVSGFKAPDGAYYKTEFLFKNDKGIKIDTVKNSKNFDGWKVVKIPKGMPVDIVSDKGERDTADIGAVRKFIENKNRKMQYRKKTKDTERER